jgi:ATP-dependent RNA helicase DBP3
LRRQPVLEAVCVYGGVQKEEQRKALKTASIVVATPGRLNDLINEGAADLGSVGYLVLDEADRMLDKGFEEDIKRIINTTPTQGLRQALMFTATWPQSVRELAATFMTSPVKISIGDNPTGELRANNRILKTLRLWIREARDPAPSAHQTTPERQPKDDRILVFVCTRRRQHESRTTSE